MAKNKSQKGVYEEMEDITGKTFGKWTAIKRAKNSGKDPVWECSCECGTIRNVRWKYLKSGKSKSCGCTKKESLIGEKYGRLSVIKESSKNNKNQRQWICVCDCGQIVCLTTHTLKTGHTLSCGCLRSESVSYHEMFISNILRESGIDFYTEKSFNSCVGLGGKPLRFDFYIPDSNLLIEYDGEQHFRPIKYFNGTAGFDRLKKNEKIKEEFCKKNNIQLLRLPYTMTDEEIKKEILSRIP